MVSILIISDFKAEINQGNQLLHSPFLQSLSSLALGLELDKVLCHSFEDQCTSLVPEWSWLHSFGTAMRTADSLTNRRSFPKDFIVPDEDSLPCEMPYQPMVCSFNLSSYWSVL